MTIEKVYDELMSRIDKIMRGGAGGSDNYNKLKNRPQINGNLLTGNKNSKQLNIAEEMTEADYAALASKNENEIYFLSENAPIFTESATVAASEITWSVGEYPDTYIATLSYSVVDTDTTGVVGVTCDNDLITIGDSTYESGSVSVPMICEDPTAITGDIEFVFTLKQPAGGTKIMHGAEEYGIESYSTKPVKVGKWIDNRDIFRVVIVGESVTGNDDIARVIGTLSGEMEIINCRCIYKMDGVFVPDGMYNGTGFKTQIWSDYLESNTRIVCRFNWGGSSSSAVPIATVDYVIPTTP